MSETRYADQPDLADPAGFARAAVHDLRLSLPVAWRLFRSSLSARHRRSLLGYVWLIIPALATAAIAAYLQRRNIVDVGSTALPYAVHVFCGMVLWQTFTEALMSPLGRLTAERQLITRSRVPHEALILSGLFDVLFNAAIRFAVLLVVVLVSGTSLGASAVLVPAGVLALTVLGLALGLLVTPVGLLYEDVTRGLLVLTAFWFFLTPIIYPAPDSGLLRLNPVTPLLDSTRSSLTSFSADGGALLVTGLAIAGLTTAWLFARLARPHVVARLG
jgi:lipopolysaccharide transport system permease protein